MSMKVNEGGSSNYTVHAAGLFPVTCIWVVNLGMQPGNYGPKWQVMLGFESPTVLRDDGVPMILTRRFGATLSPKGHLRAFLRPLKRGDFTAEELRDFDLSVLAGKALKLLVQHTVNGDKTYANIQAALPPDKGQSTQTHHPLVVFDADEPDLAVKALLPEWVRKLIDNAIKPEKPAAAATTATPDFDEDDDLLF